MTEAQRSALFTYRKAMTNFTLQAKTLICFASDVFADGSAATEALKNFATSSIELPRKLLSARNKIFNTIQQLAWSNYFKPVEYSFISAGKVSLVSKNVHDFRLQQVKEAYRNLSILLVLVKMVFRSRGNLHLKRCVAIRCKVEDLSKIETTWSKRCFYLKKQVSAILNSKNWTLQP